MVGQIDPALGIDDIGQIFRNHLSLPGKRLRSLLFLLTLRTLDPDRELDEAAYRIAVGLEFFHEFLLIHDDVIDSSDTRRGGPTLWRRLEARLGLSRDRARSIATILGDFLYAQAVDRMATSNAGPAAKADIIHVLMTAAGQTGWGAVAEIQMAENPFCDAAEDAIKAIYQAKTTQYTFEAPMLMASLLAGGHDGISTFLTAMARPLGLAFQLENDLHELIQLGIPSAPIPVDLKDRIKTLPMVRLLQSLPKDDRLRLEQRLSGPLDQETRTGVAELMTANDLLRTMRTEIDRCFAQPFLILDQADLEAKTREQLKEIVRFIQANRHHSEA